jgi:hypothetical protein
MAFTTAQLQAIKAEIAADSTLNNMPMTPDGAFAIAEALNLDSTFIVWRTSVAVADIMANGFVWTEVDALTNGKARIWDWMSRLGEINPSKANVRQGLRDCFGNTSGTYTGMLPHLKRAASRVEKVLATGTGTDANPGTLTFEGDISYQDVELARIS